jgi:hypothetical protein
MFHPEFEKKNQTQNYYSNDRLVISGSMFEFYEFSDPIMYGRRFKRKNREDNDDISYNSPKAMTEEEKIISSARRAKRNISRLIRTNAFNWLDSDNNPYMPITLTLTFADEVKDIETANGLFSDFIQRLNYSVNLTERKYNKKEAKKNLLKYSAVIEFQDKNRGGVVHYHMIFYNLPKMTKIYDRLTKIWGKGYFWVGTKTKNRKKGFAYINDNKRLKKIVEYFTKYISKSFEDERLKNKKKYFNSRELIKPTELEVEELVYMIKKIMPKEALSYEAKDLKYKYKLREKSFNYQKFDLSEFPEEMEEALDLTSMY